MPSPNREQRRELTRRLRAQGRSVVVLRDGPMDGWVVAGDAPALQPWWRTAFIEAEAERLFGLMQEKRPRLFRRRWDRLSKAERAPFQADALVTHPLGHYQVTPSESLAVWVHD